MLKFRKQFSSGYLAPIGGESGTHIQLTIGGPELVGSFVKGTELLIEPSAGLSDIQKNFIKNTVLVQKEEQTGLKLLNS